MEGLLSLIHTKVLNTIKLIKTLEKMFARNVTFWAGSANIDISISNFIALSK